MARRKRKGGRRKKPLRIAALVGFAAGCYGMYSSIRGMGKGNEARAAVRALTGYDYGDGSFNWKLATFTIPVVAGCGISMVASKVGLNRYTPRGIAI